MRRVSPWLPGRDRPRPPLAGVVQQWQCSQQGRRRQREKRQLSGRSFCCLSAGLVAATCSRVGWTTPFFGRSPILLAPHKDTSKSSPTAPPVLATRQEGRRRVRCQPASRSHPGQRQETPETPRAKRAPQESAETARTTEGLPQHNAQQACPTTTSTTPLRYQQEGVSSCPT